MELVTQSPRDTQNVARILGQNCPPRTLLLLRGPLGAGKTCFVQGLATGLKVSGVVNSPTFTIIKHYNGRLPLWHVDLYRLDQDDIWELGLDEFWASPGVVAVEWPDHFEEHFPSEHMEIAFQVLDENRRRLVFSAGGDVHSRLARELMEHVAAGL